MGAPKPWEQRSRRMGLWRQEALMDLDSSKGLSFWNGNIINILYWVRNVYSTLKNTKASRYRHSKENLSQKVGSIMFTFCVMGRSPQKGTVTSGGCQKKEHHFADYLMHFEMIYSHFWQNQTTLGLSDVQNNFAPLSFYVCHTNILVFQAFLSSEIWFGLSYSITIAAFCMPNILVYQDQESVHK